MTLYEFDAAVLSARTAPLCGVDEAGRGPLAGPVYAAAVILPPETRFEGLNDSKKLTEKKRETLYAAIIEKSTACCIAFATHEEIDSLNILQATFLAMRRAVQGLSQPAVVKGLVVASGGTALPGHVLVDGNGDPGLGISTETVIQGDGTSACIAAASILAKVARDRYLAELDQRYPQYRFAKHKGYPTKLHYQLLDQFGASPVHRKSFLKKWEAARNVQHTGV